MRILELLLIAVNLLTLVISFKRQAKAVLLGAAGINLLLLLMKGILEGYRLQMVFSYIFVGVYGLYALIKAGTKLYEAKAPKALRLMAIGLSLVLIFSSVYLAYALPVFQLPKPAGDYAVGVKYFRFIDENRMDPFLDKAPQNRQLMVKVYYPAEAEATKPFSRYFNNSAELTKLFTDFYNMPEALFSHLRLVKTNSKENLKVSAGEESYPVILFSHGAGTSMEVQTSQSEDLASHGYIVAAIDHTYVSMGTIFPDGAVSHKEATTDFDVAEPAEIITQIMAEDAAFIIDKLTEINDGKEETAFKGRLRLEEIGAIGHSVGGAVAYNLAINDSRVKAAINLDGAVYMTPPEASEAIAPFLMLANDKNHIQWIANRKPLMTSLEDVPEEERDILLSIYGGEEAYSEAYNKALENIVGLTDVLKASGNLFTIEGSDHMKFTDMGLFIGAKSIRELMGIGGRTDTVKCLEITKALTVEFFSRHLRNDETTAIESLLERYPELKQIDIK